MFLQNICGKESTVKRSKQVCIFVVRTNKSTLLLSWANQISSHPQMKIFCYLARKFSLSVHFASPTNKHFLLSWAKISLSANFKLPTNQICCFLERKFRFPHTFHVTYNSNIFSLFSKNLAFRKFHVTHKSTLLLSWANQISSHLQMKIFCYLARKFPLSVHFASPTNKHFLLSWAKISLSANFKLPTNQICCFLERKFRFPHTFHVTYNSNIFSLFSKNLAFRKFHVTHKSTLLLSWANQISSHPQMKIFCFRARICPLSAHFMSRTNKHFLISWTKISFLQILNYPIFRSI